MSRARIYLRIAAILVLACSIDLPINGQKSLSEVDNVQSLDSEHVYINLADEMETTLRKDILSVWFPRSIDKVNGGFYSNFTRDWKLAASDGKFSVFQGRMVWVASQIVMKRPDLQRQFQPIIDHGMKYLEDVLWDKQYGGFFWGLDDKGKLSPKYTDGKNLYGMSFGLYSAAAVYQARKDPKALELAQETFHWMDAHAHDAENGGYFEWLTRDGKVLRANSENARVELVPLAGFPIGYKSMNTHIHLLESFTELYKVWKDETLRGRIIELLAVVRDKICVEPGVMNLYFTTDWRAIPDHDSYGHDIETAYLMLEAEEVLGQTHDPKTEVMAKALADHALAYGWDETYGGFYREGTAFGKAEDLHKEWWVQFEGLNALLLMHEKYGTETNAYLNAFLKQWQFIKEKQIDHEFGGVYDTVERDGTVKDFTKARIWKEAYHETRALLNVTARLRALANAKAWRLIWSDEFNQRDGSPVDMTKWTAQVGGNGWGNQELEYYTNRVDNAYQSGGSLVIKAIKEKYTGRDNVMRDYTSARLITKNKFTVRYGRIEARMKIPYGQGLWPAFWMLGDDIDKVHWPGCGEIDIMENIGREPSIAHGTIHGPGYSGRNGLGSSYALANNQRFADGFHVFAVEWEPNVIRFYCDGNLYKTRTPSDLPAGTKWVYDHPFFILLNVAIGGAWPGNPDETTVFPQTMLVDYVRVYQRTSQPQ
jgi:mannobiose 2-epimerase